MTVRERNPAVDVLRGIAILLVILGHTISGCTQDYASTFLFSVIWSLQMPLFFMLSGYVGIQGSPISNVKMLGSFVAKRTAAYLLPWLVWTFLVRGLIFNTKLTLDVKYLLWHMDNGYWFLVSLWMIAVIFSIARFIVEKIVHGSEPRWRRITALFGAAALGGSALLLLGCMLGMSFLGIKLTVYYMPFYALGVLFGCVRDKLLMNENRLITNVLILTLCGTYFAVISRVNLFLAGDSLLVIALRFLTSLAGCCVLVALLGKAVFGHEQKFIVVNWIGRHSLELYLLHYLVLCMVPMAERPLAASWEGFWLCAVNFALTVAVSCMLTWLLHQNSLLRKLLFWK